jgi:hypothetical protein
MNNNDQTVSSSDVDSSPPVQPTTGWQQVRITDILEIWPVQIRIVQGQNEYFVELAEDAVIETSKKKAIPLEEIARQKEILILIEQDSRYPDALQAVHLTTID